LWSAPAQGFESFSSKKKNNDMQNYEIPHQYPIYPFPEG
jgi:hypothetical protein